MNIAMSISQDDLKIHLDLTVKSTVRALSKRSSPLIMPLHKFMQIGLHWTRHGLAVPHSEFLQDI